MYLERELEATEKDDQQFLPLCSPYRLKLFNLSLYPSYITDLSDFSYFLGF
jgi:hypothetical protein